MLFCDYSKRGSYFVCVFAIILCFATKSLIAVHLRFEIIPMITKIFMSTDEFTLLRQHLSIKITIAW